METFGIIMTVVLAVVALIALVSFAACMVMKYRARLIEQRIIPAMKAGVTEMYKDMMVTIKHETLSMFGKDD